MQSRLFEDACIANVSVVHSRIIMVHSGVNLVRYGTRPAAVYWEMATMYDCHSPTVYHIILVWCRTSLPHESYTHLIPI